MHRLDGYIIDTVTKIMDESIDDDDESIDGYCIVVSTVIRYIDHYPMLII